MWWGGWRLGDGAHFSFRYPVWEMLGPIMRNGQRKPPQEKTWRDEEEGGRGRCGERGDEDVGDVPRDVIGIFRLTL